MLYRFEMCHTKFVTLFQISRVMKAKLNQFKVIFCIKDAYISRFHGILVNSFFCDEIFGVIKTLNCFATMLVY